MFLDTDSLIAQIPCLVGSSQPLLLVYTVLHKGWISEQTVSVSGVRNVPALLPMSKYGSGLLSGTPNAMSCEVSITDTLMSVCHWHWVSGNGNSVGCRPSEEEDLQPTPS